MANERTGGVRVDTILKKNKINNINGSCNQIIMDLMNYRRLKATTYDTEKYKTSTIRCIYIGICIIANCIK